MTLRMRRRRRTRIMIALAIIVILGLFASAVYLIRAPFLRIQMVQVTGADPASQAEITAFVATQLSGNRHYFIPKNHVWEYARLDLGKSILAAFPRLSNAEPKLQSLTTLTVKVSERLPKALWCSMEATQVLLDNVSCQLLDQNGAAYSAAPEASSLVYVTYYGALDMSQTPPQFLTPQQFRTLGLLIDTLTEKAGAGPALNATVDSYGNVTLEFQNGFAVLFALDDAMNRSGVLLQRFGLALGSAPFSAHKLSEFEYLDLRFGDSLYFKLKTDASATGASTTRAQ